jgi:hypothetical protein
MPELPEVETIAVGLAPRLVGRLVRRVFVHERRLRVPLAAHDDNRLPLTPVRVLDNARRRRAEPPKKGAAVDLIPFDPMQPLVDAAVGRKPTSGGES